VSCPDAEWKGRAIRTVMFDNAKELVTGGTDELCEQQGIRVISSLTHNHNTNVITPRWAFHWNFENSSLVKHKARLVAQDLPKPSVSTIRKPAYVPR